ncbi:MAG: DUF4267 domain-containing protein [Nocardioides sp.]
MTDHHSTTTSTLTSTPTRAVRRLPAAGYLTLAAATLLLTNVARALLDPDGFARYFGAPLGGGDPTFVWVYASRTALLVGILALLVWFRQWKLLAFAFTFATVLPLTDAWLAARAGGTEAVPRHLAVAAVIALIAVALARASRRTHRDDS